MSEPTTHLAHHFSDLQQQEDSAVSGMWLFLATEVMFFGGLFAAYTIYRLQYPEAFDVFSRFLNLTIGTVNTAVLLTSSLTMALAVHAAKIGRNRQLVFFLLVTLGCAFAFLVLKGMDWHEVIEQGLSPMHYTYRGAQIDRGKLFFSLYFAMTGLHLLHVLIGIGLLGYFLVQAARHRYSPQRYLPIEIMGLYWHFVDLVWIFLFPLFYLVDRT